MKIPETQDEHISKLKILLRDRDSVVGILEEKISNLEKELKEKTK